MRDWQCSADDKNVIGIRAKWSRPQERFFFSSDFDCQEFQNICATEHCQYSRDSKLAPVWSNLKSQCWKVSSEKIRCNGVNVHLYKFLKINIQPFKTYFSMYEHLFAESHLQGFKTGKQWNTLLEQCQIWNSANALVKLFELWKCVGENDEDKIEHKIMFTDVWIFVWIFFRL